MKAFLQEITHDAEFVAALQRRIAARRTVAHLLRGFATEFRLAFSLLGNARVCFQYPLVNLASVSLRLAFRCLAARVKLKWFS